MFVIWSANVLEMSEQASSKDSANQDQRDNNIVNVPIW